MLKADGELDVNKRVDEVHQLDKILAADYVNLPAVRVPVDADLPHRRDQWAGRQVHQQPGEQLLEHVGVDLEVAGTEAMT